MPNYCYNSVTLTASTPESADKFEAFLTNMGEDNTKGIFSYFRPRPDSEDENWYSWNIENWGTKWDTAEVDWHRDENEFYLNFDTAWGPPVDLYDFITEEGEWEVYAMYEEPGMSFAGIYEDGENLYFEYNFEDENWRDGIPDDVIDFAGLDSQYEDYLDMMSEEEDEE